MMRRIPILLFWSATVIALAMASMKVPVPLPPEANDKVQHMAAFVTLSILAAWAYPRLPLLTIFLGLAAFGGMIEIIQLIPQLNRQAEFADWAADCIASGGTLLIVAALRFLLRWVFHVGREEKTA